MEIKNGRLVRVSRREARRIINDNQDRAEALQMRKKRDNSKGINDGTIDKDCISDIGRPASSIWVKKSRRNIVR